MVAKLYPAHVTERQKKAEAALAAAGYDGLVIQSGNPFTYYADDQDAPFHPTPHFAHWLPLDGPQHLLLVRAGKKPRLVRSSSLASSVCSPYGSDDLAAATPAPAPLMRTSSLPTETEEERWRRREMQSLKRLQAKRKRLERRNSMNSGKSAGSGRDDAQEPLYPSAFQLRRSVVAQGNASSSMPEQGMVDTCLLPPSFSPSSRTIYCNQPVIPTVLLRFST
jgi:hypothetical protein